MRRRQLIIALASVGGATPAGAQTSEEGDAPPAAVAQFDAAKPEEPRPLPPIAERGVHFGAGDAVWVVWDADGYPAEVLGAVGDGRYVVRYAGLGPNDWALVSHQQIVSQSLVRSRLPPLEEAEDGAYDEVTTEVYELVFGNGGRLGISFETAPGQAYYGSGTGGFVWGLAQHYSLAIGLVALTVGGGTLEPDPTRSSDSFFFFSGLEPTLSNLVYLNRGDAPAHVYLSAGASARWGAVAVGSLGADDEEEGEGGGYIGIAPHVGLGVDVFSSGMGGEDAGGFYVEVRGTRRFANSPWVQSAWSVGLEVGVFFTDLAGPDADEAE